MKHLIYLIGITFSFLACDRQTEKNEAYEVHGIDVSHYQSRIEWNNIVEQDIHFAFVKATEGLTYNDSLFCDNWQSMKEVGLIRGAYHFFHPILSPETQAQNFINWVELEQGDLPPVLDIETLNGVDNTHLIQSVKTWLHLVEINYNIKPIIYTNIKFYNKYLAGHFDDYLVWIARYNKKEPKLANGRHWHFWQYGNSGRLKGINGDVDFNVFRGSIHQLDNLRYYPKSLLSMY